MRLRILTALAVVAVVLAIGQPGGAQDGPPSLSVDRTGAKAGETVLVRGTGWEGTELVYVELCGNGGRSGSRNCDQGRATLTGVSTDGTFGAIITIGRPPVPCPCVIRATSQSSPTVATVELAVQGVPVVALEDQTESALVERSVSITEARLAGSGPWGAWFGAGAERTLHITVENTGEVAVHDPPLSIAVGAGSNPRQVVRAPELGSLEPGESTSVEVPVAFDSLAIGEQTALVRIAGFAEPIEAKATTSTYPWGLLVVALLWLQLLLLRIRNRVRRRIAARAAAGAATAELLPPAKALTPGTVIDLTEADAQPAEAEPAEAEPAEAEPADASASTVIDLDEPAPAGATEPPAEGDRTADAPPPSARAVGEPARWSAPAPSVSRVAPPRRVDGMAEAVTAAAAAALAAAQCARLEPVHVIDLREVSQPATNGHPVGGEWESADLMPNPFDHVSREQVARATQRASHPTTLTLQRSSEAVLAAAQAEADAIVATAATRADAAVAEAMDRRSDATAVLERARVEAERLLDGTLARASALLAAAEQEREAARQAAADSAAQVAAMVAQATATVEERVAAVEQDLAGLAERAVPQSRPTNGAPAGHDPLEPIPRQNLLGFDAALERAVHNALQS